MVNYIHHIENTMNKFTEDERITPWHISLYFALFQIWNNTRFKDEINIRREELMSLSKIGSANTYTRSLKELNEWGYIQYTPSKSRFKSSKVHMYRFDTTRDTTRDTTPNTTPDTSCDTSPDNTSVHLVRPFLNNTKQKENNSKLSKTREGSKGVSHTPHSPKTQKRFSPPSLEEVKDFFSKNKSSLLEAEKYYNHFQSNGWKVAGKTAMKDWQAAARNWMLRAEQYEIQNMSPAQQRLHVSKNKDYSEPL